MSAPPPGIGVLLYDDACGICRRWTVFWSGMLRRRGIDVAPLQSEWVAAKLHMEAADITRDVRLFFSDGSRICGADVYRFAMKRIWWVYPLYIVSVTPLLRSLFDRAYRAFADHRHRFSRICGLAPPG